MIYFRPLGGLCNRIRAMDSIISLAIDYGHKVTVLWVQNEKCNCPYSSLFKPPENTDIKIVEVKHELEITKVYALDNYEESIHENFKIIFPTVHLDDFLLNKELSSVYNWKLYNGIKSSEEIDALFIKKIDLKLKKLLAKETIYITSCYRLSPLKNKYTFFKPIDKIVKKVDAITIKFNNTIGVHIRRTDHIVSKKYSALKKFELEMGKYILQEDSTTFYLSTDCKETKNQLVSKFKNRIIKQEINSYDRNDKTAIKEALVDLLALSKSKKIIGSYLSSFTDMAVDIGGLEKQIIKSNVSYKAYLKYYLKRLYAS
jgi:hypothetical protein